jgi:hypothetical protein
VSPAVAEGGGGHEPPGEMIPPRRERGEVLGALLGQHAGPAGAASPAGQHRIGVGEAAGIPADVRSRGPGLLDRPGAVADGDRLDKRVEPQDPAR